MPAPLGFTPILSPGSDSSPKPPGHRKGTLHHLWRWLFIIIIVLFLLTFLVSVSYYLWQFKYGKAEDLAKIQAEFQYSQWRNNASDNAPMAPTDLTSFIRRHNPIIGSPDAKVTILAFIDFACPYSRQSYPMFKAMVNKFGPAVRVVFKQLPLTSIHPNALLAATASSCAADQNKFWEFHDRLFVSQQLDEAGLVEIAQTLSLDTEKFTRCLGSGQHRAELETDLQDAIALKVRGTPTYFINKTVIEGVPTADRWDQVIISQLR